MLLLLLSILAPQRAIERCEELYLRRNPGADHDETPCSAKAGAQ